MVGQAERLTLVIGAVALAVAVIATRSGVFTPDTRPDLYQQPGRFLAQSLQAWVGGSSGLGQANFNAGAAPVAVVVWVIRAFGAPAWMAVRLWRLLLLLVGAWGIRRYLAVLLGHRLTAAGRLLATVFWVVNPYVIVAGSTTPILLPYALLPWTLLAFVHATRHPRSWRWPAAFALAFFAQTGLNAGVVPFFQLVALPAHMIHARYAENRRWRDLWRTLMRCGFFAVIVSLYWLLPSLIATSTGAGIAGSTESPRDVARTSSYAESARLLGNWPLYGRAGSRLFLGDYTIYITNPIVLAATFAVPVAVGLALWRSRSRERLLVVALLAIALPVMVGLFPPDRPYPAGRFLNEVFKKVPASLAFRTTNKVGAVVVLAECIALVLGARAWRRTTRNRSRLLRGGAILVVSTLLAMVSAPLWNGGLYPLGYRIPGTWRTAAATLDAHDPSSRVLVVPGGTGGNYRWGMRSPDDIFPSLFSRPVAVRNTVVSRGDPAGNFLSAYDTMLAQGSLQAGSLSAVARYLGASDLLVRNDLLIEEISGPRPADVVATANADPGLQPSGRIGQAGVDTIPGGSGPATAKQRSVDPGDAAVYPLQTYRVKNPEPVVRAAPAAGQLLVDGDGEAVPDLQASGLLDGSQPLILLGDLDATSFAQAVRDGGRIVLTDTNRRRAWDINRIGNATSATLAADANIDGGNGTTTTRWPDMPRRQTVSEIEGAKRIVADRPAFGLYPFGRPSDAFDGDPTTAWLTGALGTASGQGIRIDLTRSRIVRSVTVQALGTEPARPTAVSVLVGGTRVLQALPPNAGPVTIPIAPTRASSVAVTILGETNGTNPVGLSMIQVDNLVVRDITRLPETYHDLVLSASPSTRFAAAQLPLDIVLTRQQGRPGDVGDDEEAQLDRNFDLPLGRSFTFVANLTTAGATQSIIDLTRAGDHSCQPIAELDGKPLLGQIVSTPSELDQGSVTVHGCGPLDLAAGQHRLRTIFGWRLDQVRLSSVGAGALAAAATAANSASSGTAVPGDASLRITGRSATEIRMTIGRSTGPRLLRLGESYDPRWALLVDGHDAGKPMVIDGYAVGWRIDNGAHRLIASFGPQFAVKSTFEFSLAATVGVVALIVLPVPAGVWWHRRRRPIGRHVRRPAAAGPPAPEPEGGA